MKLYFKIAALSLLIFSSSANSLEISEQDIFGKWLLIETAMTIDGKRYKASSEKYWVFKDNGNVTYVTTMSFSDKKIEKDYPYSLKNNVITIKTARGEKYEITKLDKGKMSWKGVHGYFWVEKQ